MSVTLVHIFPACILTHYGRNVSHNVSGPEIQSKEIVDNFKETFNKKIIKISLFGF